MNARVIAENAEPATPFAASINPLSPAILVIDPNAVEIDPKPPVTFCAMPAARLPELTALDTADTAPAAPDTAFPTPPEMFFMLDSVASTPAVAPDIIMPATAPGASLPVIAPAAVNAV